MRKSCPKAVIPTFVRVLTPKLDRNSASLRLDPRCRVPRAVYPYVGQSTVRGDARGLATENDPQPTALVSVVNGGIARCPDPAPVWSAP